MSIALEVTVKNRIPRDDGQDQEVETLITLNWDHVSRIIPRINGGSVLLLATQEKMIVRETRAELNKQIACGGIVPMVEKAERMESVKTDLKEIKPARKKKKKTSRA